MMQSKNGHSFFEKTTLIRYNEQFFEKSKVENIHELKISKTNNQTQWLNTYGDDFYDSFKEIVALNQFDDFLLKLFSQKHTNKVIELDGILFVGIEVIKLDCQEIDSEEMFFVLNTNFIWSVQEKEGDYFEWIRERLSTKKGIVRSKKADYLFFLILESIIENYTTTLQQFSLGNDELFATTKVKPTPQFTLLIEERKQELLKLKKAAKTLRDTIVKLDLVQLPDFEKKYFSELKEQVNNLIGDIDFELQELESKINLIFSIQGNSLNEVMKMLTIFSVIFIPLSFLAGIYGMNFENMPELKNQYGYFILLGIMCCIVVFILLYFKHKKWF